MKASFASAEEIVATARIHIYKGTIQTMFDCFLRYKTQYLQAIAIET